MVGTLAQLSLILFVLTAGLTAGLFWAYSYSVMRALATVDDSTFVTVMNKINVVILNRWFGFCFGGGLLFGALALVFALVTGGGRMTTAAGLVAYVIAMIITFAVNVPLNNLLARIDPQADDPATVTAGRRDHETRWRRANNARAVVHTVAFALACAALSLS